MFTQHFAEYITAGNPATSIATLEELARFDDAQVRRHVSETERCTALLLTGLASDRSAEVRIAVAHNPNTPLSVIRQLMHDTNPDVRFSLATNHNLALEVLIALQEDENPYVSRRATKTLGKLLAQS